MFPSSLDSPGGLDCCRITRFDRHRYHVGGGRGRTWLRLRCGPSDCKLVESTVDGVKALAWNARIGRWERVADESMAPRAPDSPGELRRVSPDLATARDFIETLHGLIHMALRPIVVSGNGPETAGVWLDNLAIEVRYRLP
jgi:hypothetical protein